ncbi:hypothetical protein ACNKHR_17430 [Shigella flexneri]
MRVISGINIAIALISKLMKGELPYRIDYPNILVLRYAHEKPELTPVRQRAYSGTTGAKRHYGRAGSVWR